MESYFASTALLQSLLLDTEGKADCCLDNRDEELLAEMFTDIRKDQLE